MARSKSELGIKVYHNKAAPLKAHKQTMMVKLTVPTTAKGKKADLDLVVVLDTSGSMKGHKLKKMKSAMKFVIEKLGRNDRLAIVPFSSHVGKHKHGDQMLTMGPVGKKDSESIVAGLVAHGDTNIKEGLDAGLKILRERTIVQTKGRAAAIFLMSDGAYNRGGNPEDAHVSHVNVHTFGFGAHHDPPVLHAIAHKSHGGVYHYVDDHADKHHLLHSFAHILAGLRTVVIMNLKVTLKNEACSTIEEVDPGTYPKTKDAYGSFTINFGDLYRHEYRRIIVILQLPAAHEEKAKHVMTVKYSYSMAKERETSHHATVKMDRSKTADPDAINRHIVLELLRREHASNLHKILHLAQKKDLEGAQDLLSDAKNVPGRIKHELTATLADELELLEEHIETQERYDTHGHAYALASISSHGRQRFAVRGNVHGVRLYATPRMDKYGEHAARGY